MLRQKIRLTFLAFFIPTLTYAANQSLYWQVPLANWGGLHDIESNQISGKWGIGWLGAHYRLSPMVGLTASVYTFTDYKWQDRAYQNKYTVDAACKITFEKLSSKILRIYGQIGGWTANSQSLYEKNNLKGSGLLLGLGGYIDLSSHFFVDLSYKRLIGVSPLGTQNMRNMNIFSLGLGIRLYTLH